MKVLISLVAVASIFCSQHSLARSYADDSQRLPLRRFSYVVPRLNIYHERHFDLFFFVNTGISSAPNAVVPEQHLLIIKRKAGAKPTDPVFVRDRQGIIQLGRDASGRITGLLAGEVVMPAVQSKVYPQYPELFAVSTGRANSGNLIHTYSGIFGFNEEYNMPGTAVYNAYGTERWRDGMAYSSYIKHVYSSGDTAKLAFHATPAGNYHLLGRSRASEGCIRQYLENAILIQQLLMANIGDVPSLNKYSDYTPRLGADYGYNVPDDRQFGAFNLGSDGRAYLESGVQKGLAIFFNDY